jgi:hypothetical protein
MNPLLLVAGALAAGGAGLGAAYRARVNGPFEATRYVWSRGLGLLCDHNGGVAFIKGQRGGRPAMRFDPALFDHVQEGDLVWMRLIALPQFMDEALPRIKVRFGLVTGDEDWAIPSGFNRSRELLEDARIAAWFSQNYDGTVSHEKLQGLPIGLDFHTISNRHKWGHWPATPAAQEADLEALRAAAKPNAQRLVRVHADFHFNKHKQQVWGDDRAAVQRALEGNQDVQFQTTKVRRLELWREKTRYAFVVSPHGNGLDCHRTWESLVLGNIVIVKRSSLDPLYEGLPVVIVDDWPEITRENLGHWHAEHNAAFARPDVQEKLTNRYWVARMRGIVAARIAKGAE